MGIHWWPVHDCFARSAVPGGVSASAVAKASDMADENLIRAERVAIGATLRRLRDPLASDPNELTLVHSAPLYAWLPTPGSSDFGRTVNR